MSLELIIEDCELSDVTDTDNTFDVFLDINTNKFHAFENDVPREEMREFVYELTDTEENIIEAHSKEILEYCLGSVTDEDEVSLRDIFMYGEFVKRIN